MEVRNLDYQYYVSHCQVKHRQFHLRPALIGLSPGIMSKFDKRGKVINKP